MSTMGDIVSVSSQGYLVFSSEEGFENFLSKVQSNDDERYLKLVNDGFISTFSEYGNSSDQCVLLDIKEEEFLANSQAEIEFTNSDFTFVDNDFTNKNNSISSDRLLSLIDKNGFIQIGHHLFKFETDNGYILETDISRYPNNYFVMFESVFDKNSMNRFGADVDKILNEDQSVIQFLDANPTVKVDQTSNPLNFQLMYGKVKFKGAPENAVAEYKAVTTQFYHSYVVWFGLDSRCKVRGRPMGASGPYSDIYTATIFFRNTSFANYHRRGQSPTNGVTFPTSHYPNVNNLNYRPYEGGRGLKAYYHVIDASYRIEPGLLAAVPDIEQTVIAEK